MFGQVVSRGIITVPVTRDGRARLDTGSGPILILVVEDDHDIADLIAHNLARAGYATKVVHSGVDVLPLVREVLPALIVLDIMLPSLSGLEICRMIRADPNIANIPVIMLTAKTEENDRIAGLEIGGDDYVTKPFSPKELVARVGAVLRRGIRSSSVDRLLSFGALVVNDDEHLVSMNGREVRLTAKEFLLLRYMLEHRGRLLSRDVLLSDVWGYTYTGTTRTVDVHIRRLREKLPVLRRAIVTVKQFGYKLVDFEAECS